MKTRKPQRPSPSCCGRLYLPIVWSALLIAINACGWLVEPPQHDGEADILLKQWSGHNETLRRAKGLMRIDISASGRTLAGRAAWAAIFPDRIRIELLSFLGQPLMKFAADGNTIAVDVHDGEPPYRTDQKPGALEKIVDIPFGVADLLNVMKGCPPTVLFAAAQLRPEKDDRKRVVLLNRWHQPVAELRASARGLIQEMAAFDGDGALLYRIAWKSWGQKGGYTFPGKIEVVSRRGERLSLQVDRLFPDVPVSKEMFEMSDAQSP